MSRVDVFFIVWDCVHFSGGCTQSVAIQGRVDHHHILSLNGRVLFDGGEHSFFTLLSHAGRFFCIFFQLLLVAARPASRLLLSASFDQCCSYSNSFSSSYCWWLLNLLHVFCCQLRLINAAHTPTHFLPVTVGGCSTCFTSFVVSFI